MMNDDELPFWLVLEIETSTFSKGLKTVGWV